MRRPQVTLAIHECVLFYFNSMMSVQHLEPEVGTTRKTTIVTDQQDDWIEAQIEGGDFTNDSEYIRDLIRRDQARILELDAIRNELIKGEQSGEPLPFDARQFKARMVAQHASKNR